MSSNCSTARRRDCSQLGRYQLYAVIGADELPDWQGQATALGIPAAVNAYSDDEFPQRLTVKTFNQSSE
jgi:hypothetical protein